VAFGSTIFFTVRNSENFKDRDFDRDGWYVNSVEADWLIRLAPGNDS
jgi:hypothetical protein